MFTSSTHGFVLNRTAHSMRRCLHRAFRRAGFRVTPEEWTLLVQLWARDGQSQGELPDDTSRDRTTVTRLLDGMVNKGLVERRPDRRDRRVARAWLTTPGKKLEDRLDPVAAESLGEVARGVSRRDLEITLRTLRRMQANVRSAPHS